MGEDHGRHADRPGADDEDAVALARAGPAQAVGADRQELDHSGMVGGEVVDGDQVGLGHGQVVAEAAVHVHAQHAQVLAAVGLAATAGDAAAAGQIGDDADRLARAQAGASGCCDDLARELVAHDPRVFEEGVLALVDVEVGAAYAGTADADQHLPFGGLGLRALHQREAPGSSQSKALIGGSSAQELG